MKIFYKYFTIGSMSEKEGMTVIANEYDENGNFFAGKPENQIYKRKEITKEQFDSYCEQIKNTKDGLGLAGGLLNEKGKKALKEHWEEQKQIHIRNNESKIALTVRKIKKQLELGIITPEDIDTEIELNNIKEFKNEVKLRLSNQ